MCDSPVVCSSLSLSDSALKCSNSGVGYCETQLDHVDENLDDNFSEVNNYSGKAESCGSSYTNSSAYTYRFQLEQDVQQLQQQLQEETELHAILENAIEKTAATLFSQSCLPLQVLELLSSIAILESTVSELEEKLISLHFQLSQERNERRLAEYRWRHSSSQSFFICSDIMKEPISSSLGCPKHPISELHYSSGSEDTSFQDRPSEGTSGRSFSTFLTTERSEDAVVLRQEKKLSMTTDTKYSQPVDDEKLTIALQPQGLSNHPCKLSEEMVRCMKNIFISLADSTTSSRSSALESHSSSLSPRGDLSSLSTWSLSERSIVPSWVQSPKVDLLGNSDVLVADDTCDPYRVCGKLSWADSGNYGLATEVSWMSVGKEQLEYASTALRRFRTLVEQLAQVNPDHLSSNEKLAFWINLYNALIMHAYLAYGVPRSDLKLFSLMQKAAYTVGGHSFTAAAIEYIILKMKPPVHRPQIALLLALHKLKVSEEQRKFEIDTYEPLAAFALSCGMYSSPAIRIYTAQNINEELAESQRDFIRASVGVSTKGRLLIPKMLHCFAKGFVDDEKLAVWISQYLPPHQSAFVEKCMSQRRQSLFGSRNCGILPFDSRFRYLFLPEKIPQ